MDAEKRKALKAAYQSMPVIGGVCCIWCSGNRRAFLQATRSVDGLGNRFRFAMSTGTCPDPSMRREWEAYGNDAFSFHVLEELRKAEDQTDASFLEDLQALRELWQEKIDREGAENVCLK